MTVYEIPADVNVRCKQCGADLRMQRYHSRTGMRRLATWCQHCQRKHQTFRSLLRHAYVGLFFYRYPACCVLHYCFTLWRGGLPAVERVRPDDGYLQVPCAWHGRFRG